MTDKYMSSISSSLAKLSHPNPLEMCVFPDEGKADHVSAPLCVDTMRVLGHGDQFGEQTAFVFSEGALSGMMTLSDWLECDWLDAFPVTLLVPDHVVPIYSDESPG